MAFGDLLDTGVTTTTSITNPVVVDASAGLSVAVSVGDLVIGVLAEQNTLTVTGVTDNLGNTYTASNAGTDAGVATGRMFYARVTTAGTLNTVNFAATASADDATAVVAVFAGPFLASAVDANIANGSDNTSPNVCPASGTLAQAVELVIGWGGVATSGTAASALSAATVGTLAVRGGATVNAIAAIAYALTASTASVSPTFTSSAGFDSSVLGTTSFMASVASDVCAVFSAPDLLYQLRMIAY